MGFTSGAAREAFLSGGQVWPRGIPAGAETPSLSSPPRRSRFQSLRGAFFLAFWAAARSARSSGPADQPRWHPGSGEAAPHLHGPFPGRTTVVGPADLRDSRRPAPALELRAGAPPRPGQAAGVGAQVDASQDCAHGRAACLGTEAPASLPVTSFQAPLTSRAEMWEESQGRRE